MPVRQAAPRGRSRYQRRKSGRSFSGFQETRIIPITTKKVPAKINAVTVSWSIATAKSGGNERADRLECGAARCADLFYPRIGQEPNAQLRDADKTEQKDTLPWDRMHAARQ